MVLPTETVSVRPPVVLTDLPVVNYDMLIPPIRRSESVSGAESTPAVFWLNTPRGGAIIAATVIGIIATTVFITFFFLNFLPWYRRRRWYEKECKRQQVEQEQWLRQSKKPFPPLEMLDPILERVDEHDLEKAVLSIGRESMHGVEHAKVQPPVVNWKPSKSSESDLSLRNAEFALEAAPIVKQKIAIPTKAHVPQEKPEGNNDGLPDRDNGESHGTIRTTITHLSSNASFGEARAISVLPIRAEVVDIDQISRTISSDRVEPSPYGSPTWPLSQHEEDGTGKLIGE